MVCFPTESLISLARRRVTNQTERFDVSAHLVTKYMHEPTDGEPAEGLGQLANFSSFQVRLANMSVYVRGRMVSFQWPAFALVIGERYQWPAIATGVGGRYRQRVFVVGVGSR